MKFFVILTLLILNLSGKAQERYVLLHRAYQKEAIYTDSITKENIKSGYYPIYASQLDSFMFLVGQFKKLSKYGEKRTYFDNNEYKTSSISVDISNSRHAYADNMTLISCQPLSKVLTS